VQVILLENVSGLGDRGKTVKVAAGYARNFLLPRKLAIAASGNAAERLRTLVKQAELRDVKLRKTAEDLAARFDGVQLKVAAHAGEEGVLFGSVTTVLLSEELEKLGHTVDKRHIEIEEPIKRVGNYEITIRLAAGVTVKVPVEVVAG
jgi:large subunit ribosomal protein L9